MTIKEIKSVEKKLFNLDDFIKKFNFDPISVIERKYGNQGFTVIDGINIGVSKPFDDYDLYMIFKM